MALQGNASLDGPVGLRIGQQADGLQGEYDVQKKTFTRWINVFLQRCVPPIEVRDLFTDIQDGRVLMALLEELSGCKLLYRFRPSSHHIFRLNNIAKALAFLDDRHVKLLSIDASSIANGAPAVVLNLIWSIILFYQIKEVTGGLQEHFSSSLPSLSVGSYPSSCTVSPKPSNISTYSSSTLPSKGRRRAARTQRYHGKAIKTLLHWVQRSTSKFGVDVYDFGESWKSGLAFLALIKSIDPGLVDLRDSLSREPCQNAQEAFRIAQHSLRIPPLLDPEDITHNSPDEQSIMTYVSMFLEHVWHLDEANKIDLGQSIIIPEIPSFQETFDSHPDAQASFPSRLKTNEQRLWKRWSTCPREPRHVNPHGQVTSDSSNNKSTASSHNPKTRRINTEVKKHSVSVIQPNSPLGLDMDTVDQDVWTWMEKTTGDQAYSQLFVDERTLSLSSEEEGVYSLSMLDSDQEAAYGYILEMKKEALRPSNKLNGRAAGVNKMETTVGTSLHLMGKSRALNESEALVEDHGHERGCGRREAVVRRNGDFNKRAFTDEAQAVDTANVDPEGNRNGVNDDHRRKRESNNRGEGDEGSTAGVREMVIEGKRRNTDEESEDDGECEEEEEEEEEEEGDQREFNFEEEEVDADDEEEEEDRGSDGVRAVGCLVCEKLEERKEELEEKEKGSSRIEDRADNIDNCEEEDEGEKVTGAKNKEGEEEEDEVDNTGRNRVMHIEDEEENVGLYKGLLGEETARTEGFRGEGGNRTEEIVEFRERSGEGLAVSQDNPGEGFDKEDERDREEEEEEEEKEEDKVESAVFSKEEEASKRGDEEEMAPGDFGVFERSKEMGEKEEEEEDEGEVRNGEEEEGDRKVEEEDKEEVREPEWTKEVKWAEEVRRAEEEGEIIEEEEEEEEEEEMFSEDVARRARETPEIKAMSDLDEGTITEEGHVAEERAETDSEEERERGRRPLVKMKYAIIKVYEEEGEVLFGYCGDEDEGGKQDNHVTNVKHHEDMVTIVEDDEEKPDQLRTVEEAGRYCSSDTTLEKDAMAHDYGHRRYNMNPHWTSARSGSSQTSSGDSVIPDSLAPSCGVTWSELELLLGVWILLYCCLIWMLPP